MSIHQILRQPDAGRRGLPVIDMVYTNDDNFRQHYSGEWVYKPLRCKCVATEDDPFSHHLLTEIPYMSYTRRIKKILTRAASMINVHTITELSGRFVYGWSNIGLINTIFQFAHTRYVSLKCPAFLEPLPPLKGAIVAMPSSVLPIKVDYISFRKIVKEFKAKKSIGWLHFARMFTERALPIYTGQLKSLDTNDRFYLASRLWDLSYPKMAIIVVAESFIIDGNYVDTICQYLQWVERKMVQIGI